MRPVVRLLLSRISQTPRYYVGESLVAPRCASYARFYTSGNPGNPTASEERSGIWKVLKNCFGWRNSFEKKVPVIVPEGEVYLIERHGKYIKTLTFGTHTIISPMDKVAHVHSLEPKAIITPAQSVLTKDKAFIAVDGILHLRVADPKLASYVILDPVDNLISYVHVVLRQAMSKMTLPAIFKKKDALNVKIQERVNDVAKKWGYACLSYEIGDITMSPQVKEAWKKLSDIQQSSEVKILVAKVESKVNYHNARMKGLSLVLEGKAKAEEIIHKAYDTRVKLSARKGASV